MLPNFYVEKEKKKETWRKIVGGREPNLSCAESVNRSFDWQMSIVCITLMLLYAQENF